MNKVFGEKKNVEYHDREGAYIIPVRGNNIAVVKTSKGYFLLGGGKEAGETDKECIVRECMEEVGCKVIIGDLICTAEAYTEHPEIGFFHPIQNYYLGELIEINKMSIEKDHKLVWASYEEIKGKMFVEMQNWVLDKCFEK